MSLKAALDPGKLAQASERVDAHDEIGLQVFRPGFQAKRSVHAVAHRGKVARSRASHSGSPCVNPRADSKLLRYLKTLAQLRVRLCEFSDGLKHREDIPALLVGVLVNPESHDRIAYIFLDTADRKLVVQG